MLADQDLYEAAESVCEAVILYEVAVRDRERAAIAWRRCTVLRVGVPIASNFGRHEEYNEAETQREPQLSLS